MTGEKPPGGEARIRAVSLFGDETLETALQAPEVQGWIGDGINIHRFIQGETLPTIISSSGLARRKRFNALHDALGIPPPDGD